MLQSLFEWIVGQPFWVRLVPGALLLGVSAVLYWLEIMWRWGWIIGVIALLLGLLAGPLAKLGLI